MGITVWAPRAFRHPHSSRGTIIAPDILRIHAQCAVLVFIPQESVIPLSEPEQKILDGMISVLNLDPDQLLLVKVYSAEPDITLLENTLQQWHPHTVLQLSMQTAAVQCNAPVTVTFSPQYLLHNAQHKPQAFKDLLTLRNILHHGTS